MKILFMHGELTYDFTGEFIAFMKQDNDVVVVVLCDEPSELELFLSNQHNPIDILIADWTVDGMAKAIAEYREVYGSDGAKIIGLFNQGDVKAVRDARTNKLAEDFFTFASIASLREALPRLREMIEKLAQ